MKKGLLFIGTLLVGLTVGAATGVKITATLQNQAISYNGSLSTQQVISYKGTTYVPLRSFSSLVNVPVDFKSGVIYLGASSTAPAKQEKFSLSINGATIGTGNDKEIVILNISFKNNSGKTMSPAETGCNLNAYQNGISLDFNYIPYSDGYTSDTVVMDGHELNFISEFEIIDHSPIVVEMYNAEGKKISTQTFNLK